MQGLILTTQDELTALVHDAVSRSVSHKPVPLVMTKKQLASYVQKPISTINRWMTEGMPFRKEGNDHPEFYRPAVDEWLHERFQKAQRKKDHAEGPELVEGNVVHLETA